MSEFFTVQLVAQLLTFGGIGLIKECFCRYILHSLFSEEIRIPQLIVIYGILVVGMSGALLCSKASRSQTTRKLSKSMES